MDSAELVAALRAIVGNANVLTDSKATEPYRTGFRCGGGKALAVVSPRSVLEQWRVLERCIAANKIIVMQAANTGLTGGSTPDDGDYDRDVVIINTMRIAKLHVIEDGRQVICLPGATLCQLEAALEPYGREPHSVIGSSCIGASVMGGICNNSGGALVRRGPAFTQMALFARLDADGRLHLVNHLGVNLGNVPEQMLTRLERGEFGSADIEHDPDLCGSDRDYVRRVREIDSDRPARFNADRERLFEAAGSAGRMMIFAVRLDTFPKDPETHVFYVGTRDPAEFTSLRRQVLSSFESLPVAGEYLHRDMFDLASVYGKDAFFTIQKLGTKRLPGFFRAKRLFDRLGSSDRALQWFSRLLPDHLPARLRGFRDRFEHHLMLKMAGSGIAEARQALRAMYPSASGDFFECTNEEAGKAFLQRFVAAGAAIRYRAVHAQDVEDIVALDVALRQNDRDWFEVLPEELLQQLHVAPLYYGHFFCHVFHQDYVVRKGCDAARLKERLCALLDARGAEYPAEHNVGHQYAAKPALEQFYRTLDPCNQFNPGIGRTSKRAHWQA